MPQRTNTHPVVIETSQTPALVVTDMTNTAILDSNSIPKYTVKNRTKFSSSKSFKIVKDKWKWKDQIWRSIEGLVLDIATRLRHQSEEFTIIRSRTVCTARRQELLSTIVIVLLHQIVLIIALGRAGIARELGRIMVTWHQGSMVSTVLVLLHQILLIIAQG